MTQRTMTRYTFKNRLSLIMVFGHILVMLAVGGMYLLSRGTLTSEELQTTFAIIVPMFVAYALMAIRYLGGNPLLGQDNQISMNPATVLVSFALPVISFVVVIILTIVKGSGNLPFDTYKIFLAGVESAFGVLTGQIMSDNFPRADASQVVADQNPTPSPQETGE